MKTPKNLDKKKIPIKYFYWTCFHVESQKKWAEEVSTCEQDA